MDEYPPLLFTLLKERLWAYSKDPSRVYDTPSQSHRRLAVVCEVHVGKVSCRLTVDDESEGVVLCDRNAGPHNIHKRHRNQSNRRRPRQRLLQKRVAGSGHSPSESRHSNAFGSSRSTRIKGRLFRKDVRKIEEIVRLSSELRCPDAYRDSAEPVCLL